MSAMPEGWSVDVQGARVVVGVPGMTDDEQYLNADEAREFQTRLHLAHLIAYRNAEAQGVDEASMPAGWSIEAAGSMVQFKVRASAAVGDFEMTAVEALVTGSELMSAGVRAAQRGLKSGVASD